MKRVLLHPLPISAGNLPGGRAQLNGFVDALRTDDSSGERESETESPRDHGRANTGRVEAVRLR